jgi:hypothetical protein
MLDIMATYQFVEVQMEEARYLSDLIGIHIDLKTAIDFCNFLLDIYRKELPDFKLVEPLSIAILIKYSRPFVTGVRNKLSINAVSELNNDELKQHSKYIALRNKHIAHSVNKFEENKVKAYYNDENVYDDGIMSIELGHSRLISVSRYEAEEIIELSKKILNYIEAQIKIEKAKILELVRNQPINEILKQGSSSFYPDMRNVNKNRKQ